MQARHQRGGATAASRLRTPGVCEPLQPLALRALHVPSRARRPPAVRRPRRLHSRTGDVFRIGPSARESTPNATAGALALRYTAPTRTDTHGWRAEVGRTTTHQRATRCALQAAAAHGGGAPHQPHARRPRRQCVLLPLPVAACGAPVHGDGRDTHADCARAPRTHTAPHRALTPLMVRAPLVQSAPRLRRLHRPRVERGAHTTPVSSALDRPRTRQNLSAHRKQPPHAHRSLRRSARLYPVNTLLQKRARGRDGT